MDQRLPSVSTTKADAEYDLQEQLHDFWRVIQRHLGLALVAFAIAIALGVIYYLRAPRTYESVAEVLITTKRMPGFGEGDDDNPVYENSIETHALLIRAPRIIERAVKQYRLDKLETLSDQESPIATIIENLTVRIREENTTVLGISYISQDPDDCQAVVDAVTATYKDYLNERSQNVGTDTLRLIENATSMLEGSLSQKSRRYEDFQKSAPLLWRDGIGVNKHHERQAAIEIARSELQITKEKMMAQFDAIKDAIRSGGRGYDAAYYKAIHELNPENDDEDWRSFRIQEYEDYAQRHVVRSYLDSLTTYYIDLLMREGRMREEYGDNHQELATVVKNKTMVFSLLQNAMEKEQNPIDDTLRDIKDPEERKLEYVEVYLETLQAELESLDRQIARLDARYREEQVAANKMQASLAEYESIKADKERTERLYETAIAKLDGINLLSDQHGGDMMELVAPAQLGRQIAPSLLRVLIASSFLGTFAGCLLAWFVDRSEDTFRSLGEIRRVMGVPVVGHIPLIRRGQQKKSRAFPGLPPMMCTVHQEASHLSEAFRGVRTSMYFSTAAQNQKVIQVTSPLPGDGKSTIVANLAVTIAKSGKSVLVLDADFRRPSLSKLLGIDDRDQPGLSAVVAGKTELLDATMETVVENLYFIPAGKRPHNPSELLSTDEFKNLLELCRERYDFVIVDTPPVLAVTDPCAVAAVVDCVMLVIRIRKGVQFAAIRASEQLESIDADVLGVIVNGVDQKNVGYGSKRYGHGYGYGYGYGYTGYGDERVAPNGSADNTKSNGKRKRKATAPVGINLGNDGPTEN